MMRTRVLFPENELMRVNQIIVFASFLFVNIAAMAEEAKARNSPDSRAGASTSPAAESVARGRSLYAHHCSHCHGFNMVTSGTVAFDLRKFPHNDKARFVDSCNNGKGGMPPWKDTLSAEQIDQLWSYILTGGKQ